MGGIAMSNISVSWPTQEFKIKLRNCINCCAPSKLPILIPLELLLFIYTISFNCIQCIFFYLE